MVIQVQLVALYRKDCEACTLTVDSIGLDEDLIMRDDLLMS